MLPTATNTQSANRDAYDAWKWAQSLFDLPPSLRDGLDPSGNSADSGQISRGSLAPAWWTNSVPTRAIEEQLFAIADGNTHIVTVNGPQEETRHYRSNDPECQDYGDFDGVGCESG